MRSSQKRCDTREWNVAIHPDLPARYSGREDRATARSDSTPDHAIPVHKHLLRLHRGDRRRIELRWVRRQHDKVGDLPRFKRSAEMLAMSRVRAAHAVGVNRFL